MPCFLEAGHQIAAAVSDPANETNTLTAFAALRIRKFVREIDDVYSSECLNEEHFNKRYK